jgi:NADPH-dependent curcumin reductase CurA
MGGWLKDGRLKRNETVFEGLDTMPDAFLGLFSGGNMGKMLVRV